MNHTAHCWLSWPDSDLLLGNFIGDSVKGRQWEAYPAPIRKGILLHRAIDSFTDNHPATRVSARRIRPWAGRYAAPVADILYDHLLHRAWPAYAQVPFDDFAEWAYRELDARRAWMPESLRDRWPKMRSGRFLHGYGHPEGLAWVLQRFNERIRVDVRPEALCAYFFDNFSDFNGDFQAFMPDLTQFVREEIARS